MAWPGARYAAFPLRTHPSRRALIINTGLVEPPYRPADLPAAHLGHHDIKDHDIGFIGPEKVQCFLPSDATLTASSPRMATSRRCGSCPQSCPTLYTIIEYTILPVGYALRALLRVERPRGSLTRKVLPRPGSLHLEAASMRLISPNI